MRIGPKMQAAIDYVRENPGCSKLAAAKAVTPCRYVWQNYAFGYNPVNRAIKAGLIIAEKIHGNRYSLTVPEEE